MEPSDLLGGKPVGKACRWFGMAWFIAVGIVDAINSAQESLGGRVRAEPGKRLDEAAVQCVGSVPDDEPGDGIVESVTSRHLVSQSRKCLGFRVDPDGTISGQLE